jgi:hypothetical protein
MLRFVRRENIKNYRHLDEAGRQSIMKLLAEEAKKQLDADDKKPAAKREVTSYDDTH